MPIKYVFVVMIKVQMVSNGIDMIDYGCIVYSSSSSTVEPVDNSHPWDHAKWLLDGDGLLIEVGGALG